MKSPKTRKTQTKLKTPADLSAAVKKIAVQMRGGAIGSVQLYGAPLAKEGFKDSFTDKGTWRDTFVDGAKFLSNFNNLGARVSVQHPAVQFALEKFLKTARGGG